MPISHLPRLAGHYLAAQWRWRTLDPASLQAFQERRARQIIDFAAEHSPFYRRHWRGCDVTDWRSLPVIDKAAMMANFDDFNTPGISGGEAMQVALAAETSRDFSPTVQGLTVGLSSGTSGHRGLFLVSPQEQAAWAGMILARALHKVSPGRTRVAFFLRSHSNLYQQVDSPLLQLHYFDLMAPLPESLERLNHDQPHIVIGPPSLLGFLAAAQEEGRLHIHPQRLIAVAEVLDPHDERRLAGCFQAPVHQIYQCTEGLLAVSCPQGSLHIQEDIVAIQCEPIGEPSADRSGEAQGTRRVMPIVTDLWRRTQPIIRYRLNDVLQLAQQPCACGSCFRVIARVEGRCDDVCYFLEPCGGRRPFFPDTIRRMVLLADAGVADYQAVQEADGQLRVHLALLPGAGEAAACAAVAASVLSVIHQYGCQAPDLAVDSVLPPPAAGSKRRRVQRLVTH